MWYGYSRKRIEKLWYILYDTLYNLWLWYILYDTLYNPWTKYEEVEIVFTKDRDTGLGHINVLSAI